MANEGSREEILHRFVLNLGVFEGPDLRVNDILMFSPKAPSDDQRQHNVKKINQSYLTAERIQNLLDKLSSILPSRAATVTSLTSIFIGMFYSPPEEATKDDLGCKFAEQKASEVWDQIEECLKRSVMHGNDEDALKSDITQMDCQLSAALTKLKNSMVRDGHMSSQALKAWVNGAAFHVHMLTYQLLLKNSKNSDPVRRILSAYLSNLNQLFERHREMINRKCKMENNAFSKRVLVDEDSKQHLIDTPVRYEEYFEAYYNHRYGTQINEILNHFELLVIYLPGQK